MSQARYTGFKLYLAIWGAIMLGLWVYVQAATNAAGGFSLSQLFEMLRHPMEYTIEDQVDISTTFAFWKLWHPYYFGIWNSVPSVIALIWFGRWTWQRFGGWSSHLGRAIMLLTIGAFTWSIGNIFWWYINIVGFLPEWARWVDADTAPYPGLPDIGYLSILPLAVVALFALMRAVAVPRSGWTVFGGSLLVAAGLTWAMLYKLPGNSYVMPHETGLETLTSSIYTITDIVLLAMCTTLLVYSRRAAGGTFFAPVVGYSVAFLALYLADMAFFPRIALETFYNGDISDLLYGAALYMIAVGTFLLARAEQKTLAQMREFEAMMASTTLADDGGGGGDPPGPVVTSDDAASTTDEQTGDADGSAV